LNGCFENMKLEALKSMGKVKIMKKSCQYHIRGPYATSIAQELRGH
jgi:hypothetical protein